MSFCAPPQAQTPSMFTRFARSGSQSQPPLKILDPPMSCAPGPSGGFFVLPADYIPTLVVWVRHESLRFVGGLVSRHGGKAHTRKENFSQWHAVKNAPFRCCKSEWPSRIASFTCLFCTDPHVNFVRAIVTTGIWT